jgi:hypothetical protein
VEFKVRKQNKNKDMNAKGGLLRRDQKKWSWQKETMIER